VRGSYIAEIATHLKDLISKAYTLSSSRAVFFYLFHKYSSGVTPGHTYTEVSTGVRLLE